MLRRQLAAFTDPARRALCHALLAHAAAALGDRATYEQSWAEAWALLDSPEAGRIAGVVLRHLGKAAAPVSDWLRVRLVVERFAACPAECTSDLIAGEIAELRSLVTRGTQARNEPSIELS